MSTVVTTGVSETPAVAADLFYYKQYFVEENNERVTKRYHSNCPFFLLCVYVVIPQGRCF